MNIDLEYLKKLISTATPGPWAYEAHGDTGEGGVGVILDENNNQIQGFNGDSDLLISKVIAPEVNSVENAAYIAAISPDVLLALIKEIEQLRHEKDFYARAMADYLQVAKMAWGGEIPSPLPGHTSSEEKMIEQFEYLNCPCCGGSGHVGDCNAAIQNMKCELANIQVEAENLKKEVDWLAQQASLLCDCIENCDECRLFLDCGCGGENSKEIWRKAAQEARIKDDANA